jgi:hypothetical protein
LHEIALAHKLAQRCNALVLIISTASLPGLALQPRLILLTKVRCT